MSTPDPTRACGTCTACCEILSIEVPGVLVKPKNAPCPHLDVLGRKCGIYAARPQPCRVFDCLWLQGLGEVHERPDRSGVMLDYRTTKFGNVLHAWEAWPGSFATPAAEAVLAGLAVRACVLCIPRQGPRRLLGPADEVRGIQQMMGDVGPVRWPEAKGGPDATPTA